MRRVCLFLIPLICSAYFASTLIGPWQFRSLRPERKSASVDAFKDDQTETLQNATLLVLGMFTGYGRDHSEWFRRSLAVVKEVNVKHEVIFIDSDPVNPLSAPLAATLRDEGVRLIGYDTLRQYADDMLSKYTHFRDHLLRVEGCNRMHVKNMSAAVDGAELLDAWNAVPPMQRRHMHAFVILLHELTYGSSPSAVLITDVRDVFFQADPIGVLRRACATPSDVRVRLRPGASLDALTSMPRVFVAPEEGCHTHTGSNWWWFRSCFGQSDNYTKHYPATTPPICGGTHLGTVAAMFFHLQTMLQLIGLHTCHDNLCRADQPLYSMAVRHMYERQSACMSVLDRVYCTNEKSALMAQYASGAPVAMERVSVQTADSGDADLVTLACYSAERKAKNVSRFSFDDLFVINDEKASSATEYGNADAPVLPVFRFRETGLYPAIVHQHPRLSRIEYAKIARRFQYLINKKE